MFKLWSEIKAEAKKELASGLGFRSWDDLSSDEKYLVWKYLEWYFFEKDEYDRVFSYGDRNCNYKFSGDHNEASRKLTRIVNSADFLNSQYKAQSYARSFLEDRKFNSACKDFYRIFIIQTENVVLEILSLYSRFILTERKNGEPGRNEEESDDEFEKRSLGWKWEIFDEFAESLNEVFLQFGVKYYLTRDGFVPRQDKKIMEEIYEPTLSYLSDLKWKKVNEILFDAFSDYRKNTKDGYSGCVTHSITAAEAFLQILIEGQTGGTKLSVLITEGQKKGLIPNDVFTQTIFKNTDSIFARERKVTSDAHPKDEYATEKNARMILNLAMIFMQHCIQK